MIPIYHILNLNVDGNMLSTENLGLHVLSKVFLMLWYSVPVLSETFAVLKQTNN